MAPIRIGIIGLSSGATTAWASRAHLPYLLSARGRSKYIITALCNSSVEAAQRAIKAYDLPAETKAYGSPADLAADPDVDFVVVSTRVDKHYETALPSVKAGKAVYVEWPLAQDPRHAAELAAAAKESGARTAVGVQGRFGPVLLKAQELLREGRIGKVLSSEVRATGGSIDRDILPIGMKYFTERAVGGNILTIGLGHLFDQVQSILGDATNLQSRVQIQRPNVRIRDPSTQEIVETTKSDVPDLIIATGTLPASDIVAPGATLVTRFRRGQPFPGEPPLVWSINGEKGEIRLTSDSGTALQFSPDANQTRIEVHDYETDKVERVEWAWADWQAELPVVTRSIGSLYDAFADGDDAAVPNFEDAAKRQEQLDGLF